MAIKIPKATDVGLGQEKSRPINAFQDINASPIGPNQFSVASQIGEAAQSIGQIAIKRYIQQVQVADENAGIESYNGFAKEVNEAANLGDNAWFARKGKNALGTYQEAQETMDKLAEKYSENLSNDNQKEYFFEKVSNHRLAMQESISRYESNQRSTYNIETEKSFVQTNIQNASLNYTDPNQIRNAENNIIQITKENREGLPEDALNLRIQSRLSTLRTEVISKLSNTSPYKAYALFQKTKDTLTPEDRDRANNYIERGAEENFYALLEQNPIKAQEALDNGFYGGVLDNKKRNQFRNAIDTQINNMARRAETKQFLSTLKNEQKLFDDIVKSNREDAFKKLYGYGQSYNADPAFIEKTKNILLETKGPTIGDKQNTITDLETSFQAFKVKKKNGDYEIKNKKTTLSTLVEFNRKVELARLGGTIDESVANFYRKRITPALVEAAKKEQGYNDSGFVNFFFDGAEDYDKGTQAIEDHANRNGLSNKSPEKVKMMARFVDLYNQIPKQIKEDPIALDKETDNLVKFVIDEKAKIDSPTLRALGVPNAVIDENGKIKKIKDGDSDIRVSGKTRSDNVVTKNVGDNRFLRVVGNKASLVDSKGNILESNLVVDVNGNVRRQK